MDYPKHIYLIWLVIVFLLGFILLSMEVIGYTWFIALFVLSLPVYWLETKFRNDSIRRRMAKGKLIHLRFAEWNWERLLYWQFVITFVVTLPGLFFDLEGVSIWQTVLAYLFIVGLIGSKYYRERKELQTVQLDTQKWLVNNYGLTKKLKFNKIQGFTINKELVTIQQKGGSSYTFNMANLALSDKEVLIRNIQTLASKLSLPINNNPSATASWSPWKSSWMMGLVFIFFLFLNGLAIVDFIVGFLFFR